MPPYANPNAPWTCKSRRCDYVPPCIVATQMDLGCLPTSMGCSKDSPACSRCFGASQGPGPVAGCRTCG